MFALRTPSAKYAVYSNWSPGGIDIEPSDQDRELYDYRTHAGRLELQNSAGSSALELTLHDALEGALRDELRGELPARLRAAQQRGLATTSPSQQGTPPPQPRVANSSPNATTTATLSLLPANP